MTSWSPCHKGNLKVIECGNLTIYAGGATRGVKALPGQIVIDLAGEMDPSDVEVYGKRSGSFGRTKKYSHSTNTVIRLYWRDYGIPGLPYQFWDDLIADLLDLSKNKPVEVLVMCMGGHGRTGTALSILAALLGAVPLGTCPVKWVRSVYCESAVETAGQLDYVEAMTGWPVTAEIVPKVYYTAYSTPIGGGTTAVGNQPKGNTTPKESAKADSAPVADKKGDADQPWAVYGMSQKDWESLENEEKDEAEAFWEEWKQEYGTWPD